MNIATIQTCSWRPATNLKPDLISGLQIECRLEGKRTVLLSVTKFISMSSSNCFAVQKRVYIKITSLDEDPGKLAKQVNAKK